MEEQNSGMQKAVAPNRKKWMTALVAIGATLVLLTAGYVGLCAYAGGNGGRMAPNTRIGGVKVGGLSANEAVAVLDNTLQQRLSSLGVSFGSAESISNGRFYGVSGTEFSYDAAGLVNHASPASAPFLARGARFLSGLLDPNGLSVDLTLDHVPSEVDQAVRELSDTDAQTTWEVRDTAVVFTKGRTGRTVDVAGLLSALTERAGQMLNEWDRSNALEQVPVEASIAIAPPVEPNFEAIREEIYTEVAEAYLDKETLEVVPSVLGKDLDVEAAKAALDAAAEGQTFRVEFQLTEPKTSTEQLNELLFRDVLGEATTRITGTPDRKTNVRVAAEFINGSILFPEEEFSFNQKCSPYTEANGYGKATAYVNGLSKDTVAGGICQASSTLYWVSLMANMETVERYAHRYEPSYVKGGLDATVYGDYGEEGSLDFRFKNNTEYPIQIEATVDSKNYIHVTIRGTNVTGVQGQPYSANREITERFKTIYEADANVPQGTTQKDPERTGYNAVTIDTYQKLVDADGKVVSEKQLYQTKYKLRNEVILFNPADLELWGIDPVTGIRAEPAPTPEVPVETGTPAIGPEVPESTAPEDTTPPILPPGLEGDPILPPGQEMTPPPAETGSLPVLPTIPPPGTIVVGE